MNPEYSWPKNMRICWSEYPTLFKTGNIVSFSFVENEQNFNCIQIAKTVASLQNGPSEWKYSEGKNYAFKKKKF